jgi:hypothetical protein
MSEGKIYLPEQRNYEYGLTQAFQDATENLLSSNIDQLCRKAGAQHIIRDSQDIIVLSHLNRLFHIKLPAVDVSLADSDEPVPLRNKVLILHYLISVKKGALGRHLITFKELPEGIIYFPVFFKRAIKPLTDRFGDEPDQLNICSGELGSHAAEFGDSSAVIEAFPRIPITPVLWQGDDEFTPTGNILFESSISSYLATEDIIVLCETIAWKMIKSSKVPA